jgi:hypothetical protein
MEPEEWEQQAAAFAGELKAVIDDLEATYWPEPPNSSFRPFWTTIKELNERLRTAQAVTLEDKLALQHRLNELCQRARQDQKALQVAREQQQKEILESLDLAREGLSSAESVDAIQEIRADLSLLRERVQSAPRSVARAVWPSWQEINTQAWTRLNETWERNEVGLSALLDEAEVHLSEGRIRETRERIKQFHEDLAQHECSHRAVRALRSRAHALWSRADEAGKQRREQYVEQAARRLDYWKRLQARRATARQTIEREIVMLERQAGSAPTGVGAALLRGQLEERRKALHTIDLEDRQLQERIDGVERSLDRPRQEESPVGGDAGA